jgi:NAD(P)-dependent dehydrogenase (short-subunit alcohol dehydrogenase family)
VFSLTGRVAVVTGAGQGVGAGIARGLAEAGARVVVNDLYADRAASVATSIGPSAAVAAFDVTDHAAVATAFADIGSVDILVNNAGIPVDGFPQTPFAESDPSVWRRFVDLNLYGVMNCTHVALPGMCERGWGRVITISEAARQGLTIGVSLYAASKAGAVGLMRHVAVEVAPLGVTVNTVSLGLIGNVQSEWADAVARTVPRRRLGTPDDIGAAVIYLASDEADWVTGQVLPVNGGAVTT